MRRVMVGMLAAGRSDPRGVVRVFGFGPVGRQMAELTQLRQPTLDPELEFQCDLGRRVERADGQRDMPAALAPEVQRRAAVAAVAAERPLGALEFGRRAPGPGQVGDVSRRSAARRSCPSPSGTSGSGRCEGCPSERRRESGRRRIGSPRCWRHGILRPDLGCAEPVVRRARLASARARRQEGAEARRRPWTSTPTPSASSMPRATMPATTPERPPRAWR